MLRSQISELHEVLLGSKENRRHEEMSSQNDSALVPHVDIYAIRAPGVRSGKAWASHRGFRWRGKCLRRGMAGHASWNILVTTVIQRPEFRQLLIFTSMRTYYKESHRCCGKYLSLDWQRQGMIGHSSGNMFVTTVVMGSEVRQPWWVTWKRSIQTSIMNTKQATEDS